MKRILLISTLITASLVSYIVFIYETDPHLGGPYYKRYIGDDFEVYNKNGGLGIPPRILELRIEGDKLFVIQRDAQTEYVQGSTAVKFAPCQFYFVDTKLEIAENFSDISGLAPHAPPAIFAELTTNAEGIC